MPCSPGRAWAAWIGVLDQPTIVRGSSPITQRISTLLEMKMGFDRKLSTAEVTAAVERAFARQEGREPKLPTRPDNPVIGELASLDSLEYELQRLESGSRPSTSWSRAGGRRRRTKM